MFFAIDLLLPQHEGRFSIAWIAATRGIRYVNKRDIIVCDVSKLCDEIFKMVMSASSRPRLRLSLSLSSRLANGLVRIHREQVKIFQNELINFLVQVRKPLIPKDMVLSDAGTQESEPTPVPKVSRKRKRKIVLTPQEQLPQLEPIPELMDLNIIIDEAELQRPSEHQVDPDLITLREEMPRRSQSEVDLDGVGEFGRTEDTLAPTLPRFLIPEVDLPVQEPVVVEKTITDKDRPRSKKRAAKEQEMAPFKIPEVVDIQVAPQIPENAAVQSAPPGDEITEAIQTAPQIRYQPETLPSPKPKRAKIELSLAKIILKIPRSHVVHINRFAPHEQVFFEMTEYENHVPVVLVKPQLENTNIAYGMDLFMEENESVDEFINILRKSPRSRTTLLMSSGSQAVDSRHVTKSQRSVIPMPLAEIQISQELHQDITPVDLHVPTTPTEELRQLRKTKRRKVAEETRKALAKGKGIAITDVNIETIVPPQEIIVAPLEGTVEIIAPPAARAPTILRRRDDIVASVSPTSSEKIAYTKNRQKRILQIVKQWNPEIQGDLNIEAVCEPPINRRNIAIAFGDLLTMHKMRYVKLNSKPDSLKLGTIDKGERILKK